MVYRKTAAESITSSFNCDMHLDSIVCSCVQWREIIYITFNEK